MHDHRTAADPVAPLRQTFALIEGEGQDSTPARPAINVIQGHGLSADDAAWASIVEAAAAGLRLPDLSADCASRLERLKLAAARASGQALAAGALR
jgi:hypothetical protein